MTSNSIRQVVRRGGRKGKKEGEEGREEREGEEGLKVRKGKIERREEGDNKR